MALAAMTTRRIPEWKIKEVNYVADLLSKYPVILIADLTKMPTEQLQKLKKKIERNFGDHVVLRVTKNTLFTLAMKKAGLDPSPLAEYLTGTNLFIFTDQNPFLLATKLSKIFVTAPAKPGDVVETEIVIPAGDTGFKPGPIMSVFGKLKIRTRVQGGTIWVIKDTKVAKPGDTVSPELASILQKLGIEPIVVKLKIKAGYDAGVVIPGEELVIDIEKYRDEVSAAVRNALWVGVEIGYPEPEVLKLAIPLAVRRAFLVAAEAGYVTPETAEIVLRTAISKALAVVAALGDKAKEIGISIEVAKPAAEEEARREEEKEKKAEEEEEEEEKAPSEEEIGAGLEGLFQF